jgi:hypothetical protein
LFSTIFYQFLFYFLWTRGSENSLWIWVYYRKKRYFLPDDFFFLFFATKWFSLWIHGRIGMPANFVGSLFIYWGTQTYFLKNHFFRMKMLLSSEHTSIQFFLHQIYEKQNNWKIKLGMFSFISIKIFKVKFF